MGHIIDLPEKELGVDIENDFRPKYIPSKGKRKVLRELKSEAMKVENVFLAPDPDREGEAIAWHVAETIKKENASIKRVMFNEITSEQYWQPLSSPKKST
jgi:DNA topoisomerase-1